LRIVSGTARWRKLSEFRGTSIRPTSDRVREALFSILISRIGQIDGKSVLDLFAGTGALGLEALSRGAASALFVDQSKESIDLIGQNAAATRLSERAEVVRADVRQFISRQTRQFDLIFMDPPYHNQDISVIVSEVAAGRLLRQGGILCVETAHKTVLPDNPAPLLLADRRKYGMTSICFYVHGDQINE